MLEEIIGYLGAVLLSLLLIPQVYQVYTTKKCDQISLYFLVLQNLVCWCWIIYGILLNAPPIIVANSIAEICALLLSYAKHKFKPDKNNNIEMEDKL